MRDCQPITIGAGHVVHLGYPRLSSLSIRFDHMAVTLCGKDWRLAGPPQYTTKGVTCQACMMAAAHMRRREAA